MAEKGFQTSTRQNSVQAVKTSRVAVSSVEHKQTATTHNHQIVISHLEVAEEEVEGGEAEKGEMMKRFFLSRLRKDRLIVWQLIQFSAALQRQNAFVCLFVVVVVLIVR